MRHVTAQRIRQLVTKATIKKGREFSKAEYRKAKRFYNTISWKLKGKFEVV